MEGKFITKPQRQKFVNEIKKTHFKLGNYVPEGEKKEKSLGSGAGVTASSLAGLMRATHFELGTDKQVKASETTSRFLPIKVPDCPYVVPDVSIDLRKTHYSLGSYKEAMSSTARSAQVTIGERAEVVMTSEFSRAHHFKYGTDKPDSTSITARDFTKKSMPLNAAEEVKAIKTELQKTHFSIGSEQPNYHTTSHQSFTPKPTQYEKASLELQKEHFKLGTDKPSYSTVYKLTQSNFAQGKQDFKEEVLKDLRQSHFTLGTSKSEYFKTSGDFKGGKPENTEKLEDSRLRKTNFTLGNFSKPWRSNYKDSHSTNSASIVVSTRDRNTDKASHFVLGNTKAGFETVHKEDFKAFNAEKVTDNKWGEYLRKHHFDMGQDKASFEPQNTGYGKLDGGKVEKNSELKNDLRVSHFLLGNDKRKMVTTNQKVFKGLVSAKSVQNLEKAHGKHSFRDGNGKFVGDTEQRSRFNWIKPVADNNFKFSLE